jgi:urease accessory protein
MPRRPNYCSGLNNPGGSEPMLRAVAIERAGETDPRSPAPFDVAVLEHDERHLRRRVLILSRGERVLVDFPEPLMLADKDVLVLDDGRRAGIVAAEEGLLDIRGRDPVHLAELAWHIGNRHLAAAVHADRILILRDHVIKAMLEGLGAKVVEVREPFSPLRGAYSGGHAHHRGHGAHDHGHSHDHARDHDHSHGHRHDHAHHHAPARHRHDV